MTDRFIFGLVWNIDRGNFLALMFSFYQGYVRTEPKPHLPRRTRHHKHWWNIQQLAKTWQGWKRRKATGAASLHRLASMRTSSKGAGVTHKDTLRAQYKKKKTLTHACAHRFLHHHLNTHTPCQYLMSRSLPGWYQLSFRDNVSDVSIPSPVPEHSPHWHRYNGFEDRTNDILASLFSLCPPLKDSIMCNLTPRQTPQAWTHSPLFPTT